MAEDEGRIDASGPEPGESHKERVDRELIELLNELRVALPGVQVLFAFLLTVPFQGAFSDLTGVQETVFFITFLLVAATTALLMAPTAYHRIRFREGDKERMLRTANKQAIAGIALLTLAMGGAVFLVTDVIYGSIFAALVGGLTAAWLVFWWFTLPLMRRSRERAA